MKLRWAVLPLLVMIGVMLVAIVKLEQGPHIPLIVGTAVASLVAWRHGYKWKEIEEMMYKGIRLALPAVVIIILVSLTIGAWIGGGVVATMIYYGLTIISPAYFLVTICIICSVVALSIGSSWSTMGTIGVAGMGIGLSMGIPAPMVAGAVISGAYFGDKMSPLSDTTNLAAGLTHTNLFEHIRHMLYTTIPGLVIALGARKVPAIPALVVGITLGFLAQVIVQGGSLADSVGALQSGYVIDTGNELVDNLFSRGGLDAMMYTVSMTIVGITFGGILEYSGMLQSIMNQIVKLAKTAGSMIASTILAGVATNATCSEQYISIVVPSRMFAGAYEKMGLQSKSLSRALEDGGTLTSVFIPWNTCGVFILGTLGVGAFEYAPYAILNFIVPVISIIYAFTGFTIARIAVQSVEPPLEKQAAQ
nr:Na+/H+ antiporter NhaC family protein [Exiguobacterium mexicanum]